MTSGGWRESRACWNMAGKTRTHPDTNQTRGVDGKPRPSLPQVRYHGQCIGEFLGDLDLRIPCQCCICMDFCRAAVLSRKGQLASDPGVPEKLKAAKAAWRLIATQVRHGVRAMCRLFDLSDLLDDGFSQVSRHTRVPATARYAILHQRLIARLRTGSNKPKPSESPRKASSWSPRQPRDAQPGAELPIAAAVWAVVGRSWTAPTGSRTWQLDVDSGCSLKACAT